MGRQTTCSFSLDAARTVIATFTLIPPAPVPVPDLSAAPAVVAPAAGSVTVQAPAAAAITPVRPSLRARPLLGGRALAGRTLTCSRGRWSGSPASYAFTWRRDGKAIIGHGSAYRVRAADRGHRIRCEVTATNAKGSVTAATSAVRVPRSAAA